MKFFNYFYLCTIPTPSVPRPNSPGDGNSMKMASKKAYHKCDKLLFNLIQLRYKLKLNKIAARWPAKAVA